MNILLTKTDTTRFGEMTSKKKTWGGFDVAALMFINLAKSYPQHNFYFYAPGDICDISPGALPCNFINLYGLVKKNVKKRKHEQFSIMYYHYQDVSNYIDTLGLTFDKAIVWFCRPIAFAEFDKGYISYRTGNKRIMLASEILHTVPLYLIKRFSVPTVYIIDDLMEINKISMDLPNPVAIYSQFNGIDKSKHYTSLTDCEVRETPIIYKQIEKLWLQGKQKIDWRDFDKTNKFILTVNAGPHKAEYIKKWIWDYNDETIVYGNWTNNSQYYNEVKNLGIDIDNVCKNVPMCDMEELMFKTKYTLVIPPQPSKRKQSNSNFVTQKVYSMIYYGILPFWCKYDYDSKNIYSEIPDFLKVSDVDEFYEKINILDNNIDLYHSLKNNLYDLLEDKYFDNRFIHEIFDDFLKI